MIRIWGLPLLYLFGMRNALLVGTNQTKFLVWGTLAEALSNIYLDYGLIYGHFGLPALGFNGAAYASILAEGIGLVVISAVIYFMQIHKSLHLTMTLPFDKKVVRLVFIKKQEPTTWRQ